MPDLDVPSFEAHVRKVGAPGSDAPGMACLTGACRRESLRPVKIPTHVDDTSPVYNKAGKVLRDRVWKHLLSEVTTNDEGEREVHRDYRADILRISQEVLSRYGMLGCKGDEIPTRKSRRRSDTRFENALVTLLVIANRFPEHHRSTTTTSIHANINLTPNRKFDVTTFILVYTRLKNLADTALLDQLADVLLGSYRTFNKGKSINGGLVISVEILFTDSQSGLDTYFPSISVNGLTIILKSNMRSPYKALSRTEWADIYRPTEPAPKH